MSVSTNSATIFFIFFLDKQMAIVLIKSAKRGAPKYTQCIQQPPKSAKKNKENKILPPSIQPQPINEID